MVEENREVAGHESRESFTISKATLRRRKSAPTGESTCSVSSLRQRKQETIKAACDIHGGSPVNTTPATIGMIEALERSKEEDIVKAMKKSKKMKRKVLPKLYKEDLIKFESSNDNMFRSIALYYSKGVMGKDKYKEVYKDSAYKQVTGRKQAVRFNVANCPIPKLVPYHRLMSYIKSIEIGKLHSVREELCGGLEESEKVNGCYREFEELVLKLAEFYLNSDYYNLLTFDEPNKFHIALGGDGAPFVKDDTACSWLVSVLNIGQGILSSKENYLVFGANCSENCLPVSRFIFKLISDIQHVSNTTYSVSCKGQPVLVKFVVGELPNDMKMLAFLAGELSNSATFFSTFADVSKDNLVNCKGSFGPEKSNTWKPWSFDKRVKLAKAVENYKQKLSPSLSKNTARNKITTFIAKQNSRQEFVPLLGDIIDKAHIEPLHLKNNACALAHRYLLKLVLSWSNISSNISSFSQVPPKCLFFKYVETLRTKCKLNRLAKKVVRWFNDTGANGKDFDYRFTGKDSRMFLHFMFLVDVLEGGAKGQSALLTIHVHAYLCLCLRDAVSLFSRVKLTDQQVSDLNFFCTSYYRGHCLYFNVNPTVWSLGKVVRQHTKEMKAKYGLGLGLNSMEGREAKHIAISKYASKTVYMYRWVQVFRHEYISIIWLREQGYNAKVKLNSITRSYVPKRASNNDPEFCSCGFNKIVSEGNCRFCSHQLRKKIKESIEKCKVIQI